MIILQHDIEYCPILMHLSEAIPGGGPGEPQGIYICTMALTNPSMSIILANPLNQSPVILLVKIMQKKYNPPIPARNL